jgi:hypothetical protein
VFTSICALSRRARRENFQPEIENVSGLGIIPALERRVLRRFLLVALAFTCLCGLASPANADGLVHSTSRFYYRSPNGQASSARIIRRYYGRLNYASAQHPSAAVDPHLDAHLRRAATIAEERAHAHTQARCWRYVKEALVAAGAISSYPQTAYARDAGTELVQKFGFKRLPMRDPYAAPVGAVIVYGHGAGGAGHVELRTRDGFVSDYRSKSRCYYPVQAIYGKFSS